MKRDTTENGRKRITLDAFSEEELYEAIHEISLSDCSIEAAFGRGLKELIPASETWYSSEIQRGTDTSDLMHATVSLVAQVLSAICQNLAPNGKQSALITLAAKRLMDNLKDHIIVAKEHDEEYLALHQAKQQVLELLLKKGQQANDGSNN